MVESHFMVESLSLPVTRIKWLPELGSKQRAGSSKALLINWVTKAMERLGHNMGHNSRRTYKSWPTCGQRSEMKSGRPYYRWPARHEERVLIKADWIWPLPTASQSKIG
jgi:hypothetical protein